MFQEVAAYSSVAKHIGNSVLGGAGTIMHISICREMLKKTNWNKHSIVQYTNCVFVNLFSATMSRLVTAHSCKPGAVRGSLIWMRVNQENRLRLPFLRRLHILNQLPKHVWTKNRYGLARSCSWMRGVGIVT